MSIKNIWKHIKWRENERKGWALPWLRSIEKRCVLPPSLPSPPPTPPLPSGFWKLIELTGEQRSRMLRTLSIPLISRPLSPSFFIHLNHYGCARSSAATVMPLSSWETILSKGLLACLHVRVCVLEQNKMQIHMRVFLPDTWKWGCVRHGEAALMERSRQPCVLCLGTIGFLGSLFVSCRFYLLHLPTMWTIAYRIGLDIRRPWL